MCCRGWRVVFEGRGLEIELYHDAIIQRNERRKLETCPAFKTLGCSELTVEDGRVVYQSLQHLMNWQQVDTVPPTRRKDWDILQPPIEQLLFKIDWVVSLQFSRLKRSILYFSWDLCKWEPAKYWLILNWVCPRFTKAIHAAFPTDLKSEALWKKHKSPLQLM